jgi:riboflavin kinase/FMN adenylyltransferase
MNSVWAVTIGNFDGLHRGHRNLIERCFHWKRQHQIRFPDLSIKILVVTFEPHPIEILKPGTVVPRLCNPTEKEKLLLNLGVDKVLTLAFTKELAAKEPDVFLSSTLKSIHKSGFVVVGENFYFGKGRKGDSSFLKQWCHDNNIECEIAPILKSDGVNVSSSRIRALIESGQMVTCARLLGRNYSISGPVVHGDKRGRTLGFPTANMVPAVGQSQGPCIPQRGVYLSSSTVDGQTFPSVTNVGVKPTVSREGSPLVIESHLIDFDGDLYGKWLTVEFLDRLRDEKKFSSVDELKQQIQEDTLKTKQRLRFV